MLRIHYAGVQRVQDQQHGRKAHCARGSAAIGGLQRRGEKGTMQRRPLQLLNARGLVEDGDRGDRG